MKPILAVLCLALSGSLPAAAAEIAVELTPARTHISWTLGDVLHTVHGTFQLKNGAIRFDPATGKAAGEIVVDATSGESGSGARDGRMHRNILESARYPAITFKPDRIDGAVAMDGDSTVQVHGSFGIHSAEHEIAVPAHVHFTNSRLDSATLDFAVPYVKWGMKDPSTLFLRVKDTVQIEIRIGQ